jgi:hypothetical protein
MASMGLIRGPRASSELRPNDNVWRPRAGYVTGDLGPVCNSLFDISKKA